MADEPQQSRASRDDRGLAPSPRTPEYRKPVVPHPLSQRAEKPRRLAGGS